MTDEAEQLIEAWIDVLDDTDYYELLGIEQEQDALGVQVAFHRFSRSFHPDLYRDKREEIRQAVIRIYRAGTEAYVVLRDQAKRASYDLGLAQGHLRYRDAPRESRAPEAAPDLPSLARTAGGRLHARQVERAIAANCLQEAAGLLEKALLAEGENPQLERRAKELMDLLSRDGILARQ
jgi:curved DNA-binding protein CbpA